MAGTVKPTLEGIVTRYRREVARTGSAPELEVRLQDVDHKNFAAILTKLLARGSVPRLTQMVSAIVDVKAPPRGEATIAHAPRPSRIREIYFEKGVKVRERFIKKTPLVVPFRVPSSSGLSYIVALSSEAPDDTGFAVTNDGVIRVKSRVSVDFPVTAEGRPVSAWRVDATVTRRIAGNNAVDSLDSIVAMMFRGSPPATPATLLARLGISGSLESATHESPKEAAGPPKANAALYTYEIEAEFIGAPETRDALRPADVTAAAESVLRLANPEFASEALYAAEVQRIAALVIKSPALLRTFSHELSLKRVLPQAIAMTRADYRAIYPPTGLYLTEKADGKRAVGLVRDGKGAIVSDRLIPAPASPAAAPSATGAAGVTALDGELVGEGATMRFYAFDVLVVAGENVTQLGFEDRVGKLEAGVSALVAAGIPASVKPYVHITGSTPPELMRQIREVYEAKRPYDKDGLIFVEPGQPYVKTTNNKWKSAHDNTIDTLIMRAPASVRGKPPFVDAPGHKLHFLFVGITPELFAALGLERCPGYADLFPASSDRVNYFPIQFSPSDTPYAYFYQHPDASPHGAVDGRVMEIRQVVETDMIQAPGKTSEGVQPPRGVSGGVTPPKETQPPRGVLGGVTPPKWALVRARDDRRRDLAGGRYFGNDFYAAERIWLNYLDPFPLEQLWEGPSVDYFARPKEGIYRAQTAAISFVKTQRILALRHAANVVDLAAGKGQDLHRYLDAEVSNLFCVDSDRAALAELVRRKYSHARPQARWNRPQARRDQPQARRDQLSPGAQRHRHAVDGKRTAVFILAADLARPHAETLEKLHRIGLPSRGADAVVCNLAVHYFLGDVVSMRNFVAIAQTATRSGGQAIVTSLIGEAVHALFLAEKVPVGGSWDVRQNGVLKYSLRRLYASDKLEAAGQKIAVLLPFSDGAYYEEYLVNTAALSAEFAARGFKPAKAISMGTHLADFEARNHQLGSELTPDDRKYIALYGELVFMRN